MLGSSFNPTCSVKDSKTQISKLKKIHSAIAEGLEFLVHELKINVLFIVILGNKRGNLLFLKLSETFELDILVQKSLSNF